MSFSGRGVFSVGAICRMTELFCKTPKLRHQRLIRSLQYRVAKYPQFMRSRQLKTFTIEPFAQSHDVGGVLGFQDAMDRDGVDVLVGKSAVMRDINDACAFLGK